MPQSPAKKFSGIFISYRRDDTLGRAGRLFDQLADHFGKDRIFRDIDTIEPGQDFVTVIENAIGSCEILVAVIGRDWLSTTAGTAQRLHDPNDFVRVEIATALRRNIRVIPILVQRASMPKPQDLPDEIAQFSRRNAIELSDLDWHNDVAQLINLMDRFLDPPNGGLSLKQTALIVASIILAVILGIGIIWALKAPSGENQTANPSAALQREQATNAPLAADLPPPPGMVYVPGGEFMMGRTSDDPRESPAHKVIVKPFYIDAHEVTCAEYKKYLDANPDQPAPSNWVNRNIPDASAGVPVTAIDWYQAKAFAAWSGKRLPTEEEWEFAARGTKGSIYPWGNVWEARLANVQTKNLTEVGKFPGLSPYGAVDMVGNAWEWTASPLTPYPNGTLSEQPAPDSKVIRGGSYIDSPSQATTTYRVGYPARSATDYSKIGFRCASDIPHTSKPQ